jgi:hypothetical protein
MHVMLRICRFRVFRASHRATFQNAGREQARMKGKRLVADGLQRKGENAVSRGVAVLQLFQLCHEAIALSGGRCTDVCMPCLMIQVGDRQKPHRRCRHRVRPPE